MGLNSVQLYAKSLTDGLASPLYKQDLVATIVPQNPGQLDGPGAFIWATQGVNRRQTAPRHAAFRQTTWTVSVWVMSPDDATNPNADSAFACLIDAIVESWVTTPMPTEYTDPVTGANASDDAATL